MGRCPLNNFTDRFKMVTHRAGIDGRFHDFRCTCITNWFANGLNELEVMKMAGHSSFETTRKFYLAMQTDLLDKAKAATEQAMESISVTPRVSEMSDRRKPLWNKSARQDSNLRPSV